MHVIDLEGNPHMLQATTINDGELNGHREFSCVIPASTTNMNFIHDIAEMWELVDHDGVTHKIMYAKRKGEGNSLTVDIKAIPLFYDDFDSDRIYEEYNEHMTANKCFSVVFDGTDFDFVIVDSFLAVQWQGFGKGDTRLKLFKKAIDRYKAEFVIRGNTIYLYSLAGRDLSVMYRHKLNASNIVQEIDASGFWTHAKGFGDFEEGEESNAKLKVKYTSVLAKIPSIGLRHAPPTYNGKVTNSDTMEKSIKTLVDDSLKISVSADIHDLRRQGYPIAQPELGDRVFLIDERIGLKQEVRVVDMSLTRDWQGNVIDLKLTFGSESIVKRHQSNISSAVGRINDLYEGKETLPMSALDQRVQEVSKIINGNTDSIFKYMSNGVMGWNGDDPNYMTRYVGDAIGFSKDGGKTYGTAMSAKLGIVADYITTGTLRAIIVEAVEMYGSHIEGTEIYGSRIEGTEIYGGLIEGTTVKGSTIISEKSPNEYIKLQGTLLESRGIHDRTWMGETGDEQIRLMFQNGQLRARNDDREWSLYFNDYGISTFSDGSGEVANMFASGFLEFHSTRYHESKGLTIGSGARLALETNGGRLYLNPNGAHVHVADKYDNYYGISASTFSQSSRRNQKRDIKVLQDNALEVINSLGIKEYKRKTSGKATKHDKWQVGIMVEEAPGQFLANGDTIDLYTYLNYVARAQQQHFEITMNKNNKFDEFEQRLSKLEEVL